MPRLHQDDCRDGGGNSASRRSLTEFLGFEPPQLAEPAAASALVHRPDDRPSESEWRWLEHASPEAAQAPGALIPPACFPPALPTAFSSYSEMAQPGLPWSEVGHFRMLWSESTTEELADLVTSLKALSPLSGSEQLSSSGPQPLSVPLGPQPRPLSPLAGSQPQPPLAGSQQQPPLAGPQGQLPLRLEQLNPWPERARAPRADDDLHFARLRRRASFCGVVSRNGTDILSWAGILPPRCADPSGGYSPKVFLGGLPWDITEHALMNALRNFQPIRVEWPGRDDAAAAPAPRGYAYVTFENEKRVRALLAASRREGTDWYFRVGTRRMRSKEVQVIPWALNDSSWVLGNSVRLRPGRTVFVGALHGMMSASALAKIMDDLFSGVVYAGIDTDKHKYPIGSGRVTFGNVHSYVRAISAAYVEIKTAKFTKRVQLNPYLEDSMCCSVCYLQQGPYFCREPTCFEYFCRSCWARQHSNSDHTPLMRTSRGAAAQARVTLPQNPLENAPAANGNHVPDADGGMPSPSSDNSESDAEQAGAAEQVLPENSWTERAAAVLPQDPSISEDNETGEPGGSWAQSRGQ